MIETFEGKTDNNYLYHYNNYYIIIDNYVDGFVLKQLMDDFTEMKSLVPQTGLRIKLKQLIEKVIVF